MSIHSEKKAVTVQTLIRKKQKKIKITALTAYDYITAKILDQCGIDLILIGDSVEMVFAGSETTVPATMDQIIYHTKVVSKAVSKSLVIADMPFLSFQISIESAIINAGTLMKQAGAHGVKIEGGRRNAKLINEMTEIGIPVLGHLGLTPQSIYKFGSYKTRATDKSEAEDLIEDAKILEESGCFAIVLEKIPSDLAKKVTDSISIPTIGIGAGNDCDGQILVTEDLLGLFDSFKPRFVRKYNNLAEQIRANISSYIEDVQSGDFPNKDESY